MINAVAILDQRLRAAGIPIDGISKENGSYRIDFRAEATQQQRDQAAAIVAAFDPAAEQATEDAAQVNRRDVITGLNSELAWLDTTIPTIDGMTAAQVRSTVKRLAQENRGIIHILVWLAKRVE